jgi:hypothetical protein
MPNMARVKFIAKQKVTGQRKNEAAHFFSTMRPMFFGCACATPGNSPAHQPAAREPASV